MPSAPAAHQRTPKGQQQQQQSQPSGSRLPLVPSSFRNQPGLSALAGGVVGPEAAGLDPSGPEHFFVTLAAYADALDALPLDLTRSFSDLRELDAVLGSHLNSLTARLNHLTALIEDPDIDRGQRLLALKEVAEEARAYKMGGEDKIRVALNTAETIISHTDYIDALVEQLDQFPELSPLLNPKKHLNLDQYYNSDGTLYDIYSGLGSHSGAHGAAGNDANGVSASNNKKKKVSANASGNASGKSSRPADNVSVAGSTASTGPTPSKKRKTVGGSASAGASSTAAGGAKVARTASNTGAKGEDDDWQRGANAGKASNGASSSSKKKGDGSGSKGSGSSSANSNNRLPRAAHASGGAGAYVEPDEEDAKNGADGTAASRSRASRPVRGAAANRSDDEEDDPEEDEEDNKRAARRGGSSRAPRVAQSGSGAGASPYAAAGSASNSASRAETPESASGAGNDDTDERRYCFCNNVSYGDMIGCDDDDCEREWVSVLPIAQTKDTVQ